MPKLLLLKRTVHHDGHVLDDLLDNVLCRVIVSYIIDVHRLSLAVAACER